MAVFVKIPRDDDSDDRDGRQDCHDGSCLSYHRPGDREATGRRDQRGNDGNGSERGDGGPGALINGHLQ